jgi:hypothetical protein
MPRAAVPFEERFWPRVNKSATCWLWTGAVHNGYGVLRRGPRGAGLIRAHVASWELTHGKVPTGLDVCHSCDVRACVRPDHLFVGSRLVNMRDAKAKGRVQQGERRPMHKLTDEAVRRIRHEAAVGPRGTRSRLAREYGVSYSLIFYVAQGERWRHIS